MTEAILQFNKRYRSSTYELLFNTKTGLEIIQGINGYYDPFVLNLPSLLDVGIMGTCTNKCAFCYQGHIDRPNMKVGHFKTIIDQVKHHTNQIALGGRGDPNKHPHFLEIVEYCRKNNVVPNYTTSGINLTDHEVEISKMCGAVAVSDYEQDYTYTALKKFIDAGIKTNIHQIFSYVTFGKCISIVMGYNPWLKRVKNEKYSLVDIDRLNAVIFLLFKPQGSGKNLPDLVPSKYHLQVFGERIFNSDAKFKLGLDSCLVNKIIDFSTPSPLQKMSIDTCEAARMSAYITPDMKFKPCSFASARTEVNILDSSIEKVWKNSSHFKSFRTILFNKNNCCPIGF